MRGAKVMSVSIHTVVLTLFLCGLPALAMTNSPLALRYARIYERELTGEWAGVIKDYSDLCSSARDVDTELAEKALYRLGMCEKKMGRAEQARSAWRELVETFPVSDPVVESARDALKILEQEMDRAPLEGVISISPSLLKEGESRKAIAFAGEWGNEPPFVTSADGRFQMVRRVAGKLPDGRRYGLIYAEHVSLSLLGADVWVSPGTTGLTVSLDVPVSLAGRVLDSRGSPVAAARIRVTGFKATSENRGKGESATASHPIYTLPLPMDRLISPVYSSTDGFFRVEGLPRGLRYDVLPEKPDYRVVMTEELGRQSGANLTVGLPEGLTIQQLSNLFTTVIWVRGNLETGAPCRWDELQQHVVVIHFGSAYGESSMRAQYPDEGGVLSRLMELYGAQGVLCIWVLPAGEGKGDAAQLALGLYPDMPVGAMSVERRAPGVERQESAQWDWTKVSGNMVIGRDGHIQAVCSDQQVFKVVKKELE